MVQKKTNTRFFRSDGGQYLQNPPVGTIVDKQIVKDEYKPGPNPSPYDFYMISQTTHAGTVNPTHYFVLQQDEKQPLPPDKLQMLTYKFTHLYYNWPVSMDQRNLTQIFTL